MNDKEAKHAKLNTIVTIVITTDAPIFTLVGPNPLLIGDMITQFMIGI